MNIRTYFKVWRALALTELQLVFVNRWSNILFLFGKSLRLIVSLVFLFVLKQRVTQFGGYTTDQVIIFFLTYQFVDLAAQIFFRGVYLFTNKIRSGEFDFTLVKPISSLYLTLLGKPDFNDTLFLIPTTAVSIWIASTLDIQFTLAGIIWYLALLLNGFLIITALHILVLVVGILITEVEGIVWMYRDLNRLGQFPITIYMEPLKLALFFLVPIGMMITIPAEVLLGLNPSYPLWLVFLFGLGFFFVSLRLWKWSLSKYTSASS